MKVLLLWYGTFFKNGTIGDLLALRAVGEHLAARNYKIDWVSYRYFPDVPGRLVNWEEITPSAYDVCIFVCGPMIKNHPNLPTLFEQLRERIKIGVGVSLFPEDHFNYFQPFDFVFERENVEESYGDLAIAAPKTFVAETKLPARQRPVVGISLRGRQGEYGVERCQWQKAEEIVMYAAEHVVDGDSKRIVFIENHLEKSGMSPVEIERLYASCDLVLTTRLHGAVLAVRNLVPFVALDQIRDIGKVVANLANCSWPHVYNVNDMTAQRLLQISTRLLAGEHNADLISVNKQLLKKANLVLNKLAILLCSIQKRM